MVKLQPVSQKKFMNKRYMKKIKKNKLKLSVITSAMILILIIGIIAVINPIDYVSFIYRNKIIIFFIGMLGIIFSVFCIFQFGKKLFDKNAIFSIDNKGINDKVNILDYPFIKWKDITRIEEFKVNNVSHLKIFIRNPKQYINQKKGFKKWVLSFNYKQYQTPILLNCTYLSCSFNMFKDNILDLYEEHK